MTLLRAAKNFKLRVKQFLNSSANRHSCMRLKRLTYDEFITAGLSASTARFLTAAEHSIPTFHIFVRPVNPRWEFWCPPGVKNVIGLWDENADPYCRWERNGKIEFVQIYHDEPDFHVVASTEQGLLAYLFEKYYEFLDWNDETTANKKAREFGHYIGFQGLEPLIKLLEEYARTNDYQRYEINRSELLESL